MDDLQILNQFPDTGFVDITEDQEQEQPQQQQNVISEDEFLKKTSLGNQQQQSSASPLTPIATAPVSLDKVISEKVAVNTMNYIFPLIIFYFDRWFTHKGVTQKDLKLTEPEKRELEPVMKNLLSYYKINFDHPLLQFSIVAGSMYASKLAELDLKQKNEKGERRSINNNDSPTIPAKKHPQGRKRKNCDVPGCRRPLTEEQLAAGETKCDKHKSQ